MKKISIKNFVLVGALLVSTMLMFACGGASTTSSGDNVSFVKSFYEEYLTASDKLEDTDAIMQKYMTSTMVEELKIRSRQNSNDSVTESQDSTGFKDIMTVKEGDDKDTVIVSFEPKNPEGSYSTRVFKVHITNENGTKKINGLDSTVTTFEADGSKNVTESKTKYANKATLTDEDKKEMESINKYYDDLEAEGYIG